MSKRTRLVVLVLVCLLFACVGAYRWSAARNAAGDLDDSDYAKLFAQATSSGRPTVVFISTTEGCCEGTLEVLEAIRESVDVVAAEFKDHINYISIDVGRLSVPSAEAVVELANRHSIREIPAVLVLDNHGQKHILLTGEVIGTELADTLNLLVVR